MYVVCCITLVGCKKVVALLIVVWRCPGCSVPIECREVRLLCHEFVGYTTACRRLRMGRMQERRDGHMDA
jgi:hypothetical protein